MSLSTTRAVWTRSSIRLKISDSRKSDYKYIKEVLILQIKITGREKRLNIGKEGNNREQVSRD